MLHALMPALAAWPDGGSAPPALYSSAECCCADLSKLGLQSSAGCLLLLRTLVCQRLPELYAGPAASPNINISMYAAYQMMLDRCKVF